MIPTDIAEAEHGPDQHSEHAKRYRPINEPDHPTDRDGVVAQSCIYTSVCVEIDQQQYHQKNTEIANRLWGHGAKVK